MGNVTVLETRKRELKTNLLSEQSRHRYAIKMLRDELVLIELQLQQMSNGIDTALVQLAESVVHVVGLFDNAGQDRESAREDAITEILSGGGKLRSEQFCTKTYASWHGQRSDHAYGYGPRHGWIIFRIGLTPEARKRDLTAEEIEAAVYYLRNLSRIQAAATAARSKAEAA